MQGPFEGAKGMLRKQGAYSFDFGKSRKRQGKLEKDLAKAYRKGSKPGIEAAAGRVKQEMESRTAAHKRMGR